MTLEPPKVYHKPVMTQEVLEGLAVRSGGTYIDCTVGDAGHARCILSASPGGRLLGMDADPEAVDACRHRMASYAPESIVVQANFANLEQVAIAHGFVPAQGVLFDLGLSARQLEAETRGFSFRSADPLDMRFDPSDGVTASELVNKASEQELSDLIFRLGEEPRARRIARAIVANRPITAAEQLAEVVRRASGYRRGRIHPATRAFQALRMAVNQELANLEAALGQVPRVLDHGGRLVTIAYHSLEDRMIKQFLADRRKLEGPEGMQPITKRVVRPSKEEMLRNRRSRSARLRVAERP